MHIPGVDATLEELPKKLLKDLSDIKVGRYAKVVLTPHHALKIQKVFVKNGRLNTIEWRGGTTVSLNAQQEIVSASAFGNMGVGPRVHATLLVRHLPKWMEKDNKEEFQGCALTGKCWNLVIVMQRMASSIRAVQVMPPQTQALFWRHLNVGRIVKVIKVLSGLGYDHNDIRHDNIGFVQDKRSKINLYLLDYGYGKLLPNHQAQLQEKITNAFCDALESVGAPPIVRQTIMQEVARM